MTVELNKQLMPTNTQRHFQDKYPDAPKAQHTRSAIIDGVIEAISTEGLEHTTVKHIIENAGITQDTFFNHYDTLDEAIYATASTVSAEIGYIIRDGRVQNVPADEKIVRDNFLFMTIATQVPAWGKLMIAALVPLDGIADISLDDFRNTLMDGEKSGIFKTPINPLVMLQIATLANLTIRLNIENKGMEFAIPETNKAVLRLLGHTNEQAEQVVSKVLG